MGRIRGLSPDITASLGRQIVSGEIAAGDSFRLQDIGERFGVSLTVAREVMLALQNKGLVLVRPRRGITVLPRDSWDLLDAQVLHWHDRHLGPIIADLEQSREVIEPWAARTAAISGTAERIADCRTAMEDLSVATESGDILEMTKADLAFHSALLRASGNSVIVQIGRVIEPALRRRDELTMHDRKKEDLTFLPMHEAIISAIERREPDEAAAAALRLIAESGTDSAEALSH